MAKYKTKPEYVDAFQWTGGPEQTEDPDWIVDAIKNHVVAIVNHNGLLMSIVSGGNNSTARVGDWIVRDAQGNIRACKPDIFEATYDRVLKRVMVCGVDCHPGDSVCNNYCNMAPQKGPMAKEPPDGPDKGL